MNRILAGILCAIGVARGGQIALGQDLLLQPLPGELLVGPVMFQQSVLGIDLPFRASAFLLATPLEDRLQIRARGVVDLASLQTSLGSIVGKIPLPTNDCDHQGGDNLTVIIWGKTLAIAGRTATVILHGDVDKWICSPFVFRIRQPFDATLPFTLERGSAQNVIVKMGIPNVDPGGPLGGVASQFIRFIGVDINGRLKEVLDRLIDPGALQVAVPEYLSLLNPAMAQVDFVSNNGNLAATAEINVMLDLQAVVALIEALINRPHAERGSSTGGFLGMDESQVPAPTP